MEKEAEKFLKAEEIAEKLVETLKELHTAATSYNNATQELVNISQRFLNLIESIQKVANDICEVIKILKEISGPNILGSIGKLESKMNEEFNNQLNAINKLKIIIIITLASSITAVIVGLIALLR
ncbi:MAG: hypothetical protein HPY57_01575 [Ignavibacteria bacterium]|nr:hypothetical protein [Ignavibacteria bacterium]